MLQYLPLFSLVFVDGGKRRSHSSVFCCCVVCFSDPTPLEKDNYKKCLLSKHHLHLSKKCFTEATLVLFVEITDYFNMIKY